MHQEAYGNVELSASNDPQQLARPYCGNFVDISTNWGRQICGGFRILAHKRGTQMPCPNPSVTIQYEHSGKKGKI
jgi:hypothetical protein